SATTPKVLIIVPAYNEGDSIADVLADVRTHLPDSDVVVIDDGSADNTAAAARAVGATVLQMPFNLGVGGAMQTGYLYASQRGYDVAVQLDGDGQHPAEEARRLVEEIGRQEVDLLIGSRMGPDNDYRFPFMRRVGIGLIAAIVWLVSGRRIADPTSGFRASSRRMMRFFARHYPQSYLGDTVEAMVMAARHGMRIGQTPVRMRPATHSSIRPIRGIFHTVCICLAILIDRLERPFPDYPSDSKEGDS
ncbi:MAG: glycosyltransferase family 2 protein, partial [Phycisphaerae bacterium]